MLLSGDNLCKTRNDPVAAGRARERFAQAQVLARVHGFDDLAGIIELRLADLDTVRPTDA